MKGNIAVGPRRERGTIQKFRGKMRIEENVVKPNFPT